MFVDLRDGIAGVHQIDDSLLMLVTFRCLRFGLHQVKLVTSEHINRSDPFLFILKQVPLLYP